MDREYDVIVVGGGHAGIEASAASARIGAKTLLITLRQDMIGEMSCNPAIGGLAKGQIVREVDALGGLMGLAADAAGIQFRVLNASKGPAVRAPRAQEDKPLYRAWMQGRLARTENLEILEAEAKGVLVKGGRVTGISTGAEDIYAKAVVITTGTFMNGTIFHGEFRQSAGRMGENASIGMSESLAALGLEIGRMKTGTPPRIHRDSIDYDKCLIQPGDAEPTPFSFLTGKITTEQVPCYITYTNGGVHGIIQENIHTSALYSGKIKGIGPRYCPSIEDKVVKFPDKEKHQIFIEPEQRNGISMYLNGVSTSLSEDVQKKFVWSIPGLEHAEFLRPGYAIEYDFVESTQMKSTLETKAIDGLFCCGQINGTSGYEEAAGQGLIAGANAALQVLGSEKFILDRESSYIGVMIDDLITEGVDEPYRMFTSRAENRLHLRADNADARLTELAHDAGLVGDERWEFYQRKMERLEKGKDLLAGTFVKSNEEAAAYGIDLRGGMKNKTSILEILKRPEIDEDAIHQIAGAGGFELSAEEIITIRTEQHYSGYLKRQEKYRHRIEGQKNKPIPKDFDYGAIPGLSLEMRERLRKVKPENLDQATRIPGITPAAVAALAIALTKEHKQTQK